MHTICPHKRDTLCFLSIARHSTAESTEGRASQLTSSRKPWLRNKDIPAHLLRQTFVWKIILSIFPRNIKGKDDFVIITTTDYTFSNHLSIVRHYGRLLDQNISFFNINKLAHFNWTYRYST